MVLFVRRIFSFPSSQKALIYFTTVPTDFSPNAHRVNYGTELVIELFALVYAFRFKRKTKVNRIQTSVLLSTKHTFLQHLQKLDEAHSLEIFQVF